MTPLPFNIQSFEHYLGEDKLMGGKCQTCGTVVVPPRPICADCGGTDLEWISLSGKGTLMAYTNIAVVPPAMAAEGYGRNNPYCSGVVSLEEGCHAVARIVGIDAGDPESLSVGMPLNATILKSEVDGVTKVRLGFEPA